MIAESPLEPTRDPYRHSNIQTYTDGPHLHLNEAIAKDHSANEMLVVFLIQLSTTNPTFSY